MPNKIPVSKVKLSQSYKSKQSLRQQLETIIRKNVSSGNISTPEELENFFDTFQSAIDALKAMPFEIYKRPRADLK